MRKFYLFYLILFMFLLVGCASEPFPEEVSIYDDLTWDWNQMTFTETIHHDILYHAGNSFDDFVILHKDVMGEEFSASWMSAYQELFSMMNEIVLESNANLGTISAYSSLELRAVCDIYTIEITLDDIFVFDAYKSVLQSIKDSMDDTHVISKIDYLNERLKRSLSSTEIEALDLLQSFYSDLVANDNSILLIDISFEELLTAFETVLAYIPSEIAQAKLHIAYNIIISLTD